MNTVALDPHRIVAGSQFGWEPQPLPFETVHEMFWQRVAELGDAPMMRQKDLGIWRTYSWREVGTLVSEIAAGLASLGFEPGQTASVLANTSREWVWTDLAVLSAGGICNGIYPTDAAEQVQYLCDDSASTFLFVEDDEQHGEGQHQPEDLAGEGRRVERREGRGVASRFRRGVGGGFFGHC